MPGLWKAWKAKSRLPPLSTSPLGISPTAGEIPTFPQLRRRGRMEKWKDQKQVFHFPTATASLSKQKQGRGRASPGGERFAPPKAQEVIVVRYGVIVVVNPKK